MERIEKKVDEIDRKLDKHIVESEAIRTKVKRHEAILSNGLGKDIEGIKIKLARIDESIKTDKHKWESTYVKLGIIGLLITTAINLYMAFIK